MKFLKLLLIFLIITYVLSWVITGSHNPFTYNILDQMLFGIAVLYNLIMAAVFSVDIDKWTGKKKLNKSSYLEEELN